MTKEKKQIVDKLPTSGFDCPYYQYTIHIGSKGGFGFCKIAQYVCDLDDAIKYGGDCCLGLRISKTESVID